MGKTHKYDEEMHVPFRLPAASLYVPANTPRHKGMIIAVKKRTKTGRLRHIGKVLLQSYWKRYHKHTKE
jgi:hypothetical protein